MFRKLFYDFFKNYTFIAMRAYFKRFKIHHTHPLPKNSSIIYAANHQNAFLDAVAMIGCQPMRVTFLTRANMFKTAIARFWLHAFYMIPIYRTRDGIRAVTQNRAIIDECIRLLNEENQPIGIFPEGNHNMKMRLRPLQKGIARIAFDAASQAKDPDNLFIVPVGICYSDHTRFRSDLLINFGESIRVADYLEDWKTSPAETTRSLLKDIHKNLSDVMIHIKSPENYQQTHETWKRHKKHYSNLYKEFLEDKKLINEIESGTFKTEPNPEEQKKTSLFFKLAGFPFYLYGLLNNLPIYGLIHLIQKKVTDIHFITPIRFTSGIFILPPVYLIQGIGVYFLNQNLLWTGVYLLSIFIAGLFSADYHFRVFTASVSGGKLPGPSE